MFRRPPAGTVSWTDVEKEILLRKRKEDRGKFSYEEDGFTYVFEEGPQRIRWTEIEKIVGYKADLDADEKSFLDIFLPGWKLTINEETPGWYQFLHRLDAVFPERPMLGDFVPLQKKNHGHS